MAAMEAQYALDTVLATVDGLVVNFPRAFSWHTPKPLKIGIYDDRVGYQRSDKLSQAKIRQSLAYYTSSPAYLASQQAGVLRVDLQGHVMGDVTLAQAQQAVKRLKALNTAGQPLKGSMAPAKTEKRVDRIGR